MKKNTLLREEVKKMAAELRSLRFNMAQKVTAATAATATLSSSLSFYTLGLNRTRHSNIFSIAGAGGRGSPGGKGGKGTPRRRGTGGLHFGPPWSTPLLTAHTVSGIRDESPQRGRRSQGDPAARGAVISPARCPSPNSGLASHGR